MADSSDHIARQREMVRAFRAAHRTRTAVETETAAHRQSQQQRAEAALAETTKATQIRHDQLVSNAVTRLKTARDMAASTSNTVDMTATNHRNDALIARNTAGRNLSFRGLDHLLSAVKIQTPDDAGTPMIALNKATAEAAVYGQRIWNEVQMLDAQRAATAARRRTMRTVLGAAVVIVILLGWIGISNVQQNRAAAQATQAIQATETAVLVATATAAPLATQAAQVAQVTATAEMAIAQVMATAEAKSTTIAIEQVDVAISEAISTVPGMAGMSFVHVPPGAFTMGSPEGVGSDNEHPQHNVWVDHFWIGLTEVTNSQYRHFLEAGGYETPDYWTPGGWVWREANSVTQPSEWNNPRFNEDDQPVTGVSWLEAIAYSRWLEQESGLDVRLPTEAEWEKAARGSDARTYPWGEAEPDETRVASFHVAIGGKPNIVGSYSAGASPYGALDMAGNVWEWTSTQYQPYPYNGDDGRELLEGTECCRVQRGGSWGSEADTLRTAHRYGLFSGPTSQLNYMGIRLVIAP